MNIEKKIKYYSVQNDNGTEQGGFESLRKAENAAKDLAVRNRGTKFFVYETISMFYVSEPITKVEFNLSPPF